MGLGYHHFGPSQMSQMEVSISGGSPKRMVCNGNPIKVDDLGVPPF
jgi:hypothetical protein